MTSAFPRLAAGVLLTLAPRTVVGLVTDRDATASEVRAATALGVRHLVEVPLLLCTTRATRFVRGVDLVHAVSMLGLAAVSPAESRLALAAAGSATGLLLTTRRTERRP